jgi:hypothetical protein
MKCVIQLNLDDQDLCEELISLENNVMAKQRQSLNSCLALAEEPSR